QAVIIDHSHRVSDGRRATPVHDWLVSGAPRTRELHPPAQLFRGSVPAAAHQKPVTGSSPERPNPIHASTAHPSHSPFPLRPKNPRPPKPPLETPRSEWPQMSPQSRDR